MLDRPTSHGGWPEGENRGWLPGSKPVNQQIGDYLTAMGLAEAAFKIPNSDPQGQDLEYKITSFEDLDLEPDIKEFLSNMLSSNDPAYIHQALELLATSMDIPADNLTQQEVEDYIDEALTEVANTWLNDWHEPTDWDDRQIYIDEMVTTAQNAELDAIIGELLAIAVSTSLIEKPPFGGNPLGIDPGESYKTNSISKAIKVLYDEKFTSKRNPNSTYKMNPKIALAKFIREVTFLNTGYLTWDIIEKELRELADELW